MRGRRISLKNCWKRWKIFSTIFKKSVKVTNARNVWIYSIMIYFFKFFFLKLPSVSGISETNQYIKLTVWNTVVYFHMYIQIRICTFSRDPRQVMNVPPDTKCNSSCFIRMMCCRLVATSSENRSCITSRRDKMPANDRQIDPNTIRLSSGLNSKRHVAKYSSLSFVSRAAFGWCCCHSVILFPKQFCKNSKINLSTEIFKVTVLIIKSKYSTFIILGIVLYRIVFVFIVFYSFIVSRLTPITILLCIYVLIIFCFCLNLFLKPKSYLPMYLSMSNLLYRLLYTFYVLVFGVSILFVLL